MTITEEMVQRALEAAGPTTINFRAPWHDDERATVRRMLTAATAASEMSPPAEAPVRWWNGIRSYDERDGTYPSFSEQEDTNHDIPLYAGVNPCNLPQVQPTDKRGQERINPAPPSVEEWPALKRGGCSKCGMGPLRESCAYPEACEHPCRELALQLNQALLAKSAIETGWRKVGYGPAQHCPRPGETFYVIDTEQQRWCLDIPPLPTHPDSRAKE